MNQIIEKCLSSLSRGIDVIHTYVAILPSVSGVYRMLDRKGEVLYVGKAKDLKKRVANYTQPQRLSVRIQRMVSLTHAMEFVTTHTEGEALLLEANFIKKFSPPYNVLLKDDKFFSYIEISHHAYPRLSKHRGKHRQEADYFGPFASTCAVKASLDILHRLFRIRSCQDSFFKNRTRPCLEYHIKRCTAPCVGYISSQEYEESVRQAVSFLKGKNHLLQKELSEKMQQASLQQLYEKAAVYRDQIQALTQIQAEQLVNTSALQEADVFALFHENQDVCVQVFFYRAGRQYGSASLFPSHMSLENIQEDFQTFLALFYTDKDPPKQVYISLEMDTTLLATALSHRYGYAISFICPKKGVKYEVMQTALENARQALQRKKAHSASHQKCLKRLAEVLQIPLVKRLEVYDNSHLQGNQSVGTMVVVGTQGFEKAAYRTFKMRQQVTKGDDYAMMREMLQRRFQGSLTKQEGSVLPDLVILDGGAGQLSVVQGLFDEIGVTIPLLAIAKGPERNAGRETFYQSGKPPYSLEAEKELLFFLQRIRDEAHRFAIGTHRKARAKAFTHSTLQDIPGVGSVRKKALLQHFGSLKAVQNAGVKDLMKVQGIDGSLAQIIYDFFHTE